MHLDNVAEGAVVPRGRLGSSGVAHDDLELTNEEGEILMRKKSRDKRAGVGRAVIVRELSWVAVARARRDLSPSRLEASRPP
jgi:hypothetical protein